MTLDSDDSAKVQHEDSAEIDIRKLIFYLWDEKVTVVLITLVSAVISVAVAITQPNIYRAESVLAPRSDGSGAAGLGRMAAQYSGLANLAGIGINRVNDGSEAAIAIARLKSRQFFKDNLYDEILIELMAAEKWDSDGGLALNPKTFDRVNGNWISGAGIQQTKPSVQKSYVRFAQTLTISEETKTGFLTIGIEHISPEIAKKWVDMMVSSINGAMRQKAIEEATRSIEYLISQRNETPIVSLDAIFSQLIEEQTKTIMLANASPDYVFQVLEPAVVSELKVKPNRSFISIFGTLLGSGFALLVVLTKRYFRGH